MNVATKNMPGNAEMTAMNRSPFEAADLPRQENLTAEPVENAWRPLLWLNHYRLLLSGTLTLYLSLVGKSPFIGVDSPALTLSAAAAYFCISALSQASILIRQPAFMLQVYGQIATDIVFVVLIMHTSGGIISGYAVLLNIVIAGAAIIVGGRTAILMASTASIAVLFEQIYSHLFNTAIVNYPQAGMLGVSYFTTAILAHILASRIRISEAVARQRGEDLKKMATINEHIIQQLDSGLMVVDADGVIQQANHAVESKLGSTSNLRGQRLDQISPFLSHQYRLWQNDNHYPPASTITPVGLELRPHFISLDSNSDAGTLLHIEDISATLQQAQQLKLASLGRLTASIAHEIRNPLAAISHASQLLRETQGLHETEIRLTDIIYTHTQRMNTIIENILQLSRSGRHFPETLNLLIWTRQFVEEYRHDHDLSPNDLCLAEQQSEVNISVDKSQLRQVLMNLVENGLRHGDQNKAAPRVQLRVYADENDAPCLEVSDSGSGISDTDVKHIFEPFFTTRNAGTGLGLYICKELCDINNARISYSNHNDCSRFVLRFSKPDPSRQ